MPAKNRLGLCAAIVTTLCLSACGSKQEASTETSTVRPVKLITVDAAGSTDVSQFPAVIGANRLSELSLQVGGMLQEFPVTESQSLERGELIARLDQRDFESALASAKAQHLNADQEYQRALKLVKEDAIARTVVEQRKTQLDVSKAQLDQAEKALSDSVLRAPFKGVVAQKMVERLQMLSPGQEVVQFMSVDSLEATIDLPARYIANIPKEESDTSDRVAFVILDAAPNQMIEAEFKEASLLADTTSQTYAITFSFRPPENLMVLPGMNATVELRFEKASEAIRVAVPLDAISSNEDGHFVWIVNGENMTVSKRAVKVEEGVGKTIVVTSGLDIKDTIVGAGAAYLSEGMEIREWQ